MIAGLMASRPGGVNEESPEAIGFGLAVIAALLAELLAIGFGIAGLCQRNRKKVFAVMGVCIGAVTLLGVIGLFIIGSVVD